MTSSTSPLLLFKETTLSKKKLFLAPMAGVTNSIFRTLCQEQGADILTTEFVSADGVIHYNQRTQEYLFFTEQERPLGIQLFGADPEALAQATEKLIELHAPDFIDLNFGCPANKVVCRHGGAALLKELPTLEKVAALVVQRAAPTPVTAKIRIGWDDSSINALTTGKILEQVGIQRLAIHGRTKAQGYSGSANWDVIEQVAQSLSLPVIGNGDISSAQEALKRLEGPVSGIMIGRAAMSTPWIFGEIKNLLGEDKMRFAPFSTQDKIAFIQRHCSQEILLKGDETRAITSMRARLMAYTKSFPQGRILRSNLSFVTTLEEVIELFSQSLKES